MGEVIILSDGRGWATKASYVYDLVSAMGDELRDSHPKMSAWLEKKLSLGVNWGFDLRAFESNERVALEDAMLKLTAPDSDLRTQTPPMLSKSYGRVHEMLRAMRRGEPPEELTDRLPGYSDDEPFPTNYYDQE